MSASDGSARRRYNVDGAVPAQIRGQSERSSQRGTRKGAASNDSRASPSTTSTSGAASRPQDIPLKVKAQLPKSDFLDDLKIQLSLATMKAGIPSGIDTRTPPGSRPKVPENWDLQEDPDDDQSHRYDQSAPKIDLKPIVEALQAQSSGRYDMKIGSSKWGSFMLTYKLRF